MVPQPQPPKRPATERAARAAAADALLAVAPLVDRWQQRLLAAHDPPLTPTQYLALRAIAAEELTAAELARRTGVSGPAVSQLLAALQTSGLVRRAPLERDRRHHALALTVAGTRALRSASALLRGEVGRLIGDLPHPEADALARSLAEVEAALAGTPPPRRPAPPPRPPASPLGLSPPGPSTPGSSRPGPSPPGPSPRGSRRAHS